MIFLEGVSMQEYLDYRRGRFPIPCEDRDCLAAYALEAASGMLRRQFS